MILPFSDDEEVIGSACRRVAEHLRENRIRFEIIAVDEDCGDNSHAVLALLRSQIRELRVATSLGRGRGFADGARQARGRVLWLVEPAGAMSALAPVGRAYRRVAGGEIDLVAVESRFTLCHRTRCLPVLDGVRGGSGFERRVARRARGRQLAVELHAARGASSPPRRRLAEGRLTRLFEALAPARLAWLDRGRS